MSLAGLPVESGRSEWLAQAGGQWAVLLEAGWARPCLPGGPHAFPGLSSVQPVVLGAVAMGLPAASMGTSAAWPRSMCGPGRLELQLCCFL